MVKKAGRRIAAMVAANIRQDRIVGSSFDSIELNVGMAADFPPDELYPVAVDVVSPSSQETKKRKRGRLPG